MRYIAVLLLAGLISCQKAVEKNIDRAQEIVNQAIESHGGNILVTHDVQFDFRDKSYSVSRDGSQFIYTRSFADDSLGQVIDSLFNSSELKRFVNGEEIQLDKEWHDKYANSVNSVLYFFQLPLPLNDGAVKKRFIGKSEIEGQSYYTILITFGQDGGGKDFEDQFMYWINLETKEVDFIAYNYITDGGGVRFRKAINKRKVNGLLVQDYINYKPEDKKTPLLDMGAQYKKGELIELSRIENINVVVSPR